MISPEAVLFEGETDSVVAPAYDGEIGILTGHAPLMALLGNGELRLGVAGPPLQRERRLHAGLQRRRAGCHGEGSRRL